MVTDPHTRLSNEESAAFDRWVSTVKLGGTPEQRAWSWARYLAALDKLTKASAALPRTNARIAKAA